MQTRSIRSKDGTPIAYEQAGEGPPLVLVHGTGSLAARWNPIVPMLAGGSTVVTYDRRGRGASGDNGPYTLEREAEDLIAIIDTLDGPVDVLGHSYGATIALEAALHTRNIRRLLLYEPPLRLGAASTNPPAAMDRLRAHLAEGDREGAVVSFYRDFPGLTDDQIDAFRAHPTWPARLDAAHTLLRELEADDVLFEPDRYRDLTTPTYYFLGGDSQPLFHASARAVEAALPACEVIVLPGQTHVAMDTAPEVFVRTVLRCLDRDTDGLATERPSPA